MDNLCIEDGKESIMMPDKQILIVHGAKPREKRLPVNSLERDLRQLCFAALRIWSGEHFNNEESCFGRRIGTCNAFVCMNLDRMY